MQSQSTTVVTSAGLIAGFAAALFALAAYAADPHYGRIAFSEGEEGDPTDVFAPDTASIFLHAELLDMVDGTKLSGTWIAEKTDAAPPNYKIDSTTLAAGGNMKEATFSITKPNAGWPVGDYRVDMTINGQTVKSAKFRVEK